MPYKVQIRPSCEIITGDDGHPYVREIIRWDGEPTCGTPVDHGPFDDYEQTSRFLVQRMAYLPGFLNHMAKYLNDDYPPFVFEGVVL
jgi:hypothetical protein